MSTLALQPSCRRTYRLHTRRHATATAPGTCAQRAWGGGLSRLSNQRTHWFCSGCVSPSTTAAAPPPFAESAIYQKIQNNPLCTKIGPCSSRLARAPLTPPSSGQTFFPASWLLAPFLENRISVPSRLKLGGNRACCSGFEDRETQESR